ncbi:hypothetical protein BY996DRAFT_2164812 [Phakopsora pachyrhizi]|nr:hypothetical protein BY996DRAFT_2164812 [Phakopsora pachyrhizi]
MDVDEETMVLISDTEKLDRSIQDTSTLSSQSSLSTISCTSTTGNETRERIGRDNRIRRKLELLIRDKESFNRSQESLDESNDLMDLSSYYCSHPLRESYLAYSDSEGSCSESSDGLEEMRSSILTIRPSRPRIFPPTDNLDESTKEDGSDDMRRNEEDYEGSVSPGHKDHDDFLDGSTNRLRNVLNRVFDQLTVW